MFFATDIAKFLACQHIPTLDREQKNGALKKKVYTDPAAELLRKLRVARSNENSKQLALLKCAKR